MITARDADADGHGTELCSEKPGDDCDDASPERFRSAQEKCDGIDNDCNGAIDLDDDLGVGGTAHDVGELQQTGAIALAQAGNRYALLYLQKPRIEAAASSARLLLTDALAMTKTERTLPETFSTIDAVLAGGSTVLAGGRDAAGYAHVERVRPTDAVSQPLAERLSSSPAGPVALVPLEANEVLAVWAQTSGAKGVFGRRIAADGALGSAARLTSDPGNHALQHVHGRRNAGSGDTALTWLEYGPAEAGSRIPVRIAYAVLDPALASRSSEPLAEVGLVVADFDAFNWLYAMRPQVTPVGDRFLFGWLNFDRQLVVASVDSKGAVACGPRVLPNVVGSWNAMHALESNGEEALAVLSNAADRAVLIRLDSRCAVVGKPLELQSAGARLSRGSGLGSVARGVGFGHPAIARTDSGFAVAWIEESAPAAATDGGTADAASAPVVPVSDAGSGAPRLMLRTFGSRVCD